MHFIFLQEVAFVAQLKDSLITGSLRVTDTIFSNSFNLASLTASQAVVTDATKNLISRAITNTTSASAITASTNLITANTLAYWNGAYSGTSSRLTILGNVTTGTWNATAINPNRGGTGVNSYAKGDILYAGAAIASSATTALSKLTIGSSGQVLQTTSSGIPGWITATNANTASTIVKRDANGGFSAGTINSPSFELFPGSTANHGGYFDFHYNDDSSDYTIRLIGTTDGLQLTSKAGTACWLYVGNGTDTAGIYWQTFGGGIYMTDNVWLRSYNSKSLYMGTGGVRTDLVSGGLSIIGSHEGAFQVLAASTAATDSFFQSWFSGYTSTGSWGMGALSGRDDLWFIFGTHTNYNNGTNNVGTIKFGSDGKVYGAVWNDYAEYRKSYDVQPGYCYTETNEGIMKKADARLLPGCKLASDTFGFAIGKTQKNKTPIAVSGRVLAYPYRDRTEYPLGAAVCSAPDGTIDIMTREEIMMYPERIIATVSEIPDYDVWYAGGDDKEGNIPVKVDGRIWVYVR